MRELLQSFHLRVRALLHRKRLRRELEEELQAHLDARADRYRADGLEPGHAAQLSRQSFGNPSVVRETLLDQWTFRGLDTLVRDVRYAGRMVRRQPGYASVVVLTLALGIGANTTVFSLFDRVVLRPLPYPEASRLVVLWGNVQRERVERRGTSLPDYVDWRDQSRSFDGMALYTQETFTLAGEPSPEHLAAESVAQPYFELLGVQPTMGRTFRPDEDQVPLRDAVVVLSDGLWKRRFGGDPGVVGRAIQLDDRSYEIVGVLPEGFRGVTDTAELWVPLHMCCPPEMWTQRSTLSPAVLARLRVDTTLAEAQREMDAIAQGQARAYPETNEGRGVEVIGLAADLFGPARLPLTVLLGAVGLVLLIACANVATLLLVRSEARRREIALRAALGAGRGRVLRQLTTETLLLALLGAGGGLILARWGLGVLMAASPIALPSVVHPSVDLRVALFTGAVACGIGLLIGLVPALHTRSTRLQEVFRQSSRQQTVGRNGLRFRAILVATEIALAMVLVVGAGLLMRTLQEMSDLRLGYEPSRLLTLRVGLPESPASADSAAPWSGAIWPPVSFETGAERGTVATAQDALDRVARIPGVETVAVGSDGPFTGASAIFYTAEGQPPVAAADRPRAYLHGVTPDFFATLQAPFVDGRSFTEVEARGDANVAVVSEGLARRFWPDENAVGNRIKAGGAAAEVPWLTIVGVVTDLRYRGLPNNPTDDPDLFLPFAAATPSFMLLIRTSRDPMAFVTPIRQAVQDVDRQAVLYNVSTATDLVNRRTSGWRFTSWLMGIFAASALLLATIGVYGAMAYAVARRTSEIGVRMALGATRWTVLRLIAGHAATVAACGLVLGTAGALGLARVIESLLYGVTPYDPGTFTVAAVALSAVTLTACAVPVLRAARIAPATALGDP